MGAEDCGSSLIPWEGTDVVQAAICLPSIVIAKYLPSQAPRGAQGMDNNLPVIPQALVPLLHPMRCSATAWEKGGQPRRGALLETVT